MTPFEQIVTITDRLFGNRRGCVIGILGVGGHFNEHDKYEHDQWEEYSFRWPAKRRILIDGAIEKSAEHDIYFLPHLRSEPIPGKGYGLGSRYIWCDLDNPPEGLLVHLFPLLSQGSFLVRSGRGVHLYLRLDEIYPSEVVERLNRSLAHFLGGDSKWYENAVLRLPGTFNHKGRAAEGESFPVVLEDVIGSFVPPWKPSELLGFIGGSEGLESTRPNSEKSSGPNQRRAGRRSPRRLVPVDPEPVPAELASEIRNLLNRPLRSSKSYGDQSRSGQLYHVVAELIALGCSDGVVMDVCMSNREASEKYDERLPYEIQRCIEKLRQRHDHVGRSCTEIGCDRGSNRSAAPAVQTIQVHFNAYYSAPRCQSTDSRLFEAICRLALKLGKLEFDISQRDLCKMAAIGSRETIRKSLARLQKAGYLKKVRIRNEPDGRQKDLCRRNRTNRYKVTTPSDKVDPHSHIHRESLERCGMYGSDLSSRSALMLDPTHDIWRHSGLASAYPTFKLIFDQPLTCLEIAKRSNRSVKTIRRHLVDKLLPAGVAEQKDDGKWCAFERDPDEIADLIGVRGSGLKQELRHKGERDAYEAYLRGVAVLEESVFLDSIKGYVQMRPGIWAPPVPTTRH